MAADHDYPDLIEEDALDLDEIEAEQRTREAGEESTQVPAATQEVQGRAAQSSSGLNLTAEEELDIICSLCPISKAAIEAAERVAVDSPQHILRNQTLSGKNRHVVEKYAANGSFVRNEPAENLAIERFSQATPEIAPTPQPITKEPGEIALRMSSKVHNLDMGFVFGRDQRKSDIMLRVGDPKTVRVSGMHCRIYLNDNGLIMIEDTSTNGTVVDNVHLKCKKPFPGNSVRRVLSDKSVIDIFIDDHKKAVRFLVRIPQRRDELAWKNKLQAYVNEIVKVRAQRGLALQKLGATAGKGQASDPTEARTQEINETQHSGDVTLLTAGTMPYNHGMRWNGGGTYRVIGKLGSGAFATVYKLINVQDGKEIAAKEIEKRRFMKNNILDVRITTELEILTRCKHPHVIESFSHIDTPRDLYILMEFVPFGDLSQHVGTKAMLSDRDHRLIAKQMCQALAYLHDNGIAHRDIKPENIVKKAVNPIWVKLADFGLSKVINHGEKGVFQTFCGTLLYCAPEIYPGYAAKLRGEPVDAKKARSSPYSVAVDIWSLAAVMFHLVCRTPPYEASPANYGSHMLEQILHDRFPRTKFEDAAINPDWEIFFLNSLQLTPAQRWSARRLLKLSFMQTISDVAPITYRFQRDEHPEESSDDELMDELASIVEESMDYEDEATGLDASQLSINDANPLSDGDDEQNSMPGVEEYGESNSGLGIHGVVTSDVNGRETLRPSEDRSRYNLRSRNISSQQPASRRPVSGLRKGNGKSVASAQMTPAVPQQAGMLFGEIPVAESGVFGSVATTPRIAKAAGAGPYTQAPTTYPQNPSLRAASIAAGFTSPVKDRSHRQATDSAASLHGAENQIDKLRVGSPETEWSVGSSLRDTPAPLSKSKHLRGDDESDAATSVKRSRIMHAPGSKPSVNGIAGNSQAKGAEQAQETERAGTPEAEPQAETTEQQTPRAGKSGVRYLALTPEHGPSFRRDMKAGMPDSAMTQAFPHVWHGNGNGLQSANDAQTMPPPPRKSPSNPSRPATPVLQANPENPLVTAVGVLTPSSRSIKVDPVPITLEKTTWGRAPSCSHRYPDENDRRIPRLAFTIMLYDPKIPKDKRNDADWTQSNFYAMISTHSSKLILINGVPMSHKYKDDDEVRQLGLLQTGDVIEVYDNQKGEHLRFHARFFFGMAKEERDNKNDSFRVYVGERAMMQAVVEKEARRSDRTIKG